MATRHETRFRTDRPGSTGAKTSSFIRKRICPRTSLSVRPRCHNSPAAATVPPARKSAFAEPRSIHNNSLTGKQGKRKNFEPSSSLNRCPSHQVLSRAHLSAWTCLHMHCAVGCRPSLTCAQEVTMLRAAETCAREVKARVQTATAKQPFPLS